MKKLLLSIFLLSACAGEKTDQKFREIVKVESWEVESWDLGNFVKRYDTIYGNLIIHPDQKYDFFLDTIWQDEKLWKEKFDSAVENYQNHGAHIVHDSVTGEDLYVPGK